MGARTSQLRMNPSASGLNVSGAGTSIAPTNATSRDAFTGPPSESVGTDYSYRLVRRKATGMMSPVLIRSAALSLAFLACAGAAPAQRGPGPLKVILDTDIGTDIDDAWALGLAMTSPEFELLAVTVTDGDTAARARLACKLLHIADRDGVPVAVGRPTLPPKGVDYQFTWAEDFTAKRAVTRPAAQ